MPIACSRVEDISDEEVIISGIARAFKISKIPIKKADSIIIKPNLCYYWDASTGQTTSPILVGALIEFLRDNLRNDPEIVIGEADASAMKTRHAFKMLGYEDLAEEKEVELLNLSNKPIVECSTTAESRDIKLNFSKKLLETDLLINVPKLKYHRLPKITCAMKNIFGAIAKPFKFSYHPNLAETIVAANKIINSDVILVDGLVALGNHPKTMKTLLLGNDTVTMDKVCSRIMGFNPRDVRYLRLAEREGMKKGNGSEVIGETSIKELKSDFPHVSYWKQRITWGLQLLIVNTYAKVVGDTIPPILLKE
jgi:uncharacterized protein (DUF362 family)